MSEQRLSDALMNGLAPLIAWMKDPMTCNIDPRVVELVDALCAALAARDAEVVKLREVAEMAMRPDNISRGTLAEREQHPSADNALIYLNRVLDVKTQAMIRESLASCAIEGNRLGEVCGETLDRLLNEQGVSDRYLLGLAWVVREILEK